MDYITVFDVLQRGIDWFPVVIGIAFILFGVVDIKNKHNRKGTYPKALVAILIGTLVSIGMPVFQYNNVLYYRQVLTQHNAQVVEGTIENFHPMPKQGHDTERFTVDGVVFAYSDFFSTPAFNNTSSHGGPLKEGLYVRIYFTDSREFDGYKAILRIDVKQ